MIVINYRMCTCQCNAKRKLRGSGQEAEPPSILLGVYMGKIRDVRAGEMAVLDTRAAELNDMLKCEYSEKILFHKPKLFTLSIIFSTIDRKILTI